MYEFIGIKRGQLIIIFGLKMQNSKFLFYLLFPHMKFKKKSHTEYINGDYTAKFIEIML